MLWDFDSETGITKQFWVWRVLTSLEFSSRSPRSHRYFRFISVGIIFSKDNNSYMNCLGYDSLITYFIAIYLPQTILFAVSRLLSCKVLVHSSFFGSRVWAVDRFRLRSLPIRPDALWWTPRELSPTTNNRFLTDPSPSLTNVTLTNVFILTHCFNKNIDRYVSVAIFVVTFLRENVQTQIWPI